MTIETKISANGRRSFYINGVRTNKKHIEDVIIHCYQHHTGETIIINRKVAEYDFSKIFVRAPYIVRALNISFTDDKTATETATETNADNGEENTETATNESRFQVHVYYETTEGAKGSPEPFRTETAQQAAQFVIDYATENTDRKVTEVFIKDWKTYKKYGSNDADIQALNSNTAASVEIDGYDENVFSLLPTLDELNDVEEITPNTAEREIAKKEYIELCAIKDLAIKEYEKIQSLRNRCKDGSPKRKAYNAQLAQMDIGFTVLGPIFLKANDRYTQSLIPTADEQAATRKASEELRANYRAQGINFFATVYYFPHGVEGENMEVFSKDCKTFKEAADFVSQEYIDGVYVGGIFHAGFTIKDLDDNIVADDSTGVSDDMITKIDGSDNVSTTDNDTTTDTSTDTATTTDNADTATDTAETQNAKTYITKTAKNGATTLYFSVTGKRISKTTALENENNVINGSVLDRYNVCKSLLENSNRPVPMYELCEIVNLTKEEYLACAKADNHSDTATETSTEPADEFAQTLAALKAEYGNADASLAKAQEIYNKAKDNLQNFISEQAYQLKKQLDTLAIGYTITLKKESGTTYRVSTFDEIYIGAYRVGCGVEFHFENWKGKTIARYDTPAQIEKVIGLLKDAIARGDKEFTFPTVEELNAPPESPTADTADIADSLTRAMKIALEKFQDFCKLGNLSAANRELDTYNICRKAFKEIIK